MLNDDVLRQQGAHQEMWGWSLEWSHGAVRNVQSASRCTLAIYLRDLRPQGCVIECSFKSCVSWKDVIGSDGTQR